MPLTSSEAPDTPWQGVSGAEISPFPDGSRSVRVASRSGAVSAWMLEEPGCGAALLFAGPLGFQPTFQALGRAAAARGITGFSLAIPGSRPPGEALDSARGFLRLRGVRRFALIAGGEAAPAADLAAGARDVAALALVSPRGAPALDRAHLSRTGLVLLGRPDDDALQAWDGPLGRARERLLFAGASETLVEVAGDVAASLLPRLLEAVRTGLSL